MHKVLEKANVVGEEVTEEEVLDEILALGRAYAWMHEFAVCKACFERAKEGFVRLLGEAYAKSAEATHQLLFQTVRGDNLIAESRVLW